MKPRFDTEEVMLNKLESADLTYFAEEWCIPKVATKNAFEDICREVRSFAEDCKHFPALAEDHLTALLNKKKKILSELIKKHSLLMGDSIL